MADNNKTTLADLNDDPSLFDQLSADEAGELYDLSESGDETPLAGNVRQRLYELALTRKTEDGN